MAVPDDSQRYALLEDALQVLPMLWGPGNPSFAGQVISLPDTTCYPAAAAGAGADPGRRRRRAADPAAGCAIRRRRERVR